jgi:class 3 adenylate cyclase
VIADRFEDVTILFCDLVGFTKLAARIAPGHLVENLNRSSRLLMLSPEAWV